MKLVYCVEEVDIGWVGIVFICGCMECRWVSWMIFEMNVFDCFLL